MSGIRNRWAKGYQVIAVAGLIVAVLGLFAPAAEPTTTEAAKGEAKVKKAKKARETLASLKTLSEATKKDAEPHSKAKLPPRPEKVVTKPTLTPAALDLLIDKHLAEAKVPEASATTDVEFVRRVTST